MSVCYYYLILLQHYGGGNDAFWRHWLFVNMQFTKEDKILIKNLLELKGYTAKQLVREFPSKWWNVGSVYKLLQKLRVTGTVVPAIEQSVKSLVRRAFIGHRLPVSFTKICVSSALRSDVYRSCLTPTAKLACRDRGCCFGSSQNML